MNLFINHEIKQLFMRLCSILGAFTGLSQIGIRLIFGTWSLLLLGLSAAASLSVLAAVFLYLRKENRILDEGAAGIEAYLAGNRETRIECDREGSLYKLFHAVNTLAAVLNTQAEKEEHVKDFLKNTISDISHQLKTPIAAMSIYNGILQEETMDQPAIHEFVVKSELELDRIDMLVQNLLKITRLDAGSIQMELSFENISGLMKGIRRQFEYRAGREKKAIVLSGSENAFLSCDKTWMTEAVSNLVKNALDHTEEGGLIEIEWKELPAVTQIVVKDNGCGIHPEDIHHIFKRFYRSRFSKDTQGVGLGLPLAKAIVEEQGGSITVDSAEGKGSVFTLNFLNLTEL
ncbi:sensor histidine kinase [Clostridium sp. MCC353]|uniref:sensor histidine kinase n=1 Tax=Clostridium sp. MCC353 TaxID=2592646 RepID=UPI001C0280F5|nr:HAMP domain-containing sensor histidine kinase [Clostridium sp. MCC353]MBT9776006.1 sensor histidine kinase [Clostridium sp. MCC353]